MELACAYIKKAGLEAGVAEQDGREVYKKINGKTSGSSDCGRKSEELGPAERVTTYSRISTSRSLIPFLQEVPGTWMSQ